MKKIILIFLFFNFVFLYSQPTHKIMSYNALNYPGSTATVRNPYFSTVISNANPDILVMQEMTSQVGVNEFLTNVLIPINSNFTSGTFLDGPDTDTSVLEKQIDEMVYKLYNLTYEEVEIIDHQIGNIISKTDYEQFQIE